MLKFHTNLFILLSFPLFLNAQFCGLGQEEIYRRCNGVDERLCIVRDNWKRECSNCWIIEYGACSGQSSGGQMSFNFYGEAKDAAEEERNNGDNSCPWYNDQNYRIILDDISTCPVLEVNKNPANMGSGSSGGGGGHFGNDDWDETLPGFDPPAGNTNTNNPSGQTTNSPNTANSNHSTYGGGSSTGSNNYSSGENPSDFDGIDIEVLIQETKENYIKEMYRLTGHYPSSREIAEWESILRSTLKNGDLDPETILRTYGGDGGKSSNSREVGLPTFDAPTIKTFGPNYSGSGSSYPSYYEGPSNKDNLGNGNGMYKEKPYTDPGPIDLNGKRPE
jgi:hypothetical protein